ncbi:metal ABC transporter substrate-binding protein [Microbulbifer sp.]|uniref:metal ABC transporter substrate-binding protein n=1 Tax=Microbulbifer sp. TaxID=1908541 RepID=UPI00258DDCFC|nr:metal ABC transporter substrate-binding protein [Microbulbifer sp.]
MPSSLLQTLRVILAAGALTWLVTGCGEERTDTVEDESRAQAPRIVVSIAPLAMLAREVAGPNSNIHTLISSGDPHQYAPRVADRAAMERASLLVWMGPAVESVMARQMALLPEEKQLTLLNAEEYELDGADQRDPHLWLRPRNAARMAAHIANRLAALDPIHADDYRQRARDFSRAMANLQKVQDRALWGYKDVPVVTTHLAYSQFFGPAGIKAESLSGSDNHQHGARTMLDQGRTGIGGNGDSERNRGCLFGEVPANDRDRQTAAHLGLGYRALDPLGRNLPEDAGYRQLMEKLLSDARQCLGQIVDRSIPESQAR